MKFLTTVDSDRLQRAKDGLATGAYTITVTRQDDRSLSAYITNGDHKTYAVTLMDGQAFCSCPDMMYRGETACKHAIAVALNQKYQPPRYHVGDRVYLAGHPSAQGKVVAVSGDTISVWWDRGGIRPLLKSQINRLQ